MIIKKVAVKNFRKHEEYVLDVKNKKTIIVGANGVGKTSLLEAIYIILTGKSFKGVDRDILRSGAEFYKIDVKFADGKKVSVVFQDGRKSFVVDERKFGRLPKQEKYPVVLFEPDDLNLVGGSPTRRRNYFDRNICLVDEKYHNSLLKYMKVLRQRNEALKVGGVTETQVFSWNILLARYGAEVARGRKRYVERVNEKIGERYWDIAGKADEVYVEYISNAGVSEAEYLRKLERDFERDSMTGHTNFGVHRDDFVFRFNEGKAETTVSRGELRSVILSLKFVEAGIFEEGFGKKPVILLDDVFSELDETRRRRLTEEFENNQIIMTSVEAIEIGAGVVVLE
jgi:DNA replication and repair protein RecF